MVYHSLIKLSQENFFNILSYQPSNIQSSTESSFTWALFAQASMIQKCL